MGPALALALFAVYWLAPLPMLADPRYSLLLSHSLAFQRSFDLIHYFPRPLNPQLGGDDRHPYHVELVGKELRYFFPVGGSILAIPAVVVAELVGAGPVGPDGAYNLQRETTLQHFLAAALIAFWAWLVFQTCLVRLSVGLSACVTLAAGLGTQALSTASQQLWSDTWGLVLLQIVLWLLLRARRVQSGLLGTLLAWSYIVRPTYSIAVLAVLAYLALERRWRLLAWTMATGSAWGAMFVAWSKHAYGTPLPSYYDPASRFSLALANPALLGNLVSPSRGLFVFVPAAAIVLAILLLRWRTVPDRRLAAVAVAAVLGHWAATSAITNNWWGGVSYGPRLMTGALPWLVLICIEALAALTGAIYRRTALALCMAAGLVGIAMNAPGAFSVQALLWTSVPADVGERPERLWSWRDPQFLAPLRR